MKQIYVTKKIKVCAAHRLHSNELSDQENVELYGVCNNFHGHGHNYILEVTFVGNIDLVTGMVINFNDIEKLLKEHIIEKLDHKHLNHDVAEFKELVPTAENIAVICWELLAGIKVAAKLHKIKLYETEESSVEYYGN